MPSDAVRLLEESLKRPPDGRAALASSLLDSLDQVVDEDVEQAWALEIARRLEEVPSGAVRAVPWAEARPRIFGE